MKNVDRFLILFLLFVFIMPLSFAGIRLPKLVSDGMVLQRNTNVNVWGWASPGEMVTVHFMDSEYQSTADEYGNWHIDLPKMKAGGPYEMMISASDTVSVRNIMVGDVWLCSGQSNMDLTMQRVSPLYEDEIKNAGNPDIRYFSVPAVWKFGQPQNDLLSGKWESISPGNILGVSAVAYFFADAIYGKYHIPLGIIRASLGGTPAEAWISEDAIKAFPKYYDEAQKFEDPDLIRMIQDQDRTTSSVWYTELNRKDKGYKTPGKPWYSPDLDISNWKVMQVPGYWADNGRGEVNGVVWFRKDIDLPADMAGKDARINLGRIVDADSVFVNGTFVGTVSYQYPPRRYHIPGGVLKEGKNTIVVRLISNTGKGGFVPDKPYELIVDNQTIDLEGPWYYRFGAEMDPLPSQTFIRRKPTGLYNGMLAPLTDYTIKGVVWYQGESNASRAVEYQTLFPALIKNWREKWNQGDFPFIYVQLPNYLESTNQPVEDSDWAMLREAQAKALSLPNTAMAIAIDLGEWNDVHPLHKKDVGERLALAAEKTAYHERHIVASGPMYKSMKVKGNKIVLTFTGTGSGLKTKDGGEPGGFAIAGKDHKFVWANAGIKGNKVIVWSDQIDHPVAVRYAWANNPVRANVYNKEGLPMAPFRTDE
ncbi:MAG TPA: sialate O-acetylesterase [Bacteroidales bacterium]|nr:sialate O-acetylesterase [Bacteroidales bacterium]